MAYKHIKIPKEGSKITLKDGSLQVPDNPIIPFIEGDGIGIDITPAMIDVVDNAHIVGQEMTVDTYIHVIIISRRGCHYLEYHVFVLHLFFNQLV